MDFLLVSLVLFLLVTGQRSDALRNPKIYTLKKQHSHRVLTPSGGLRASRENVPGKSRLPVSIIGVGASERGSQSISNNDFQGLLDTSDAWIQKRTGIRSRRVLVPNESAGLRSMAIDAAKNALFQAGMTDGKDIQLVIVASSSPDDLFGDAPSIASAVGASTAVAFDITAACSGFVFAVITAAQYIQSGAYKNALVVGADALSRHVDWADRGSCILFGDGAGAAVLTHTPGESGILGFAMHSDGRGYQHLTLPFVPRVATLQEAVEDGKTLPVEAKVSRAPDDTASCPKVDVGRYGRLAMNGAEVFRFAVSSVPDVIREALANSGLAVEEVDHFVLHQANFRIIEHVAKELGVDLSRFVVTLEDSGNTSAASIPLALTAAVSGEDNDNSGRKAIREGDVVVICGFGAGLSWGAAVLRWGGKL